MAPTMQTVLPSRWWNRLESQFDHIAIGLSGLCAIHCLATSILLAAVASAGALLNPAIHETGLVLAILFGVFALGRGIFVHGYMMPAAVGGLGLGMMAGAMTLHESGGEAMWTILGVAVLALGHDLNRRATH